MFIVWGKKLTHRREGYAADFCEMCRSIQIFQITGVHLKSHVYHVTLGQGEFVGYERTCRGCNITMDGNQRGYRSFEKKLMPLAELKAATFPNLEKVYSERLKVAEEARRAPSFLSRDERLRLIAAPLILLSPTVDKHFAATHIDKEVGLAIIAALALFFGGPYLAMNLSFDTDAVAISALVFLALGIGLVGWQAVLSRRRFFKRKVIPIVVKAVRSLGPTRAEIESVLHDLARRNHKIGKKLKIEDLEEQLNAAAADPSSVIRTNS
jgi:hypothetical protein